MIKPLSIIAIIQARMSSTRLPGKVLLPIGDQPMLVRVIERARRAKTLSGLVVATTTDVSDDPIAHLCLARGYPCVRGSLHDVLDRYHQAAQTFDADVIVRITADCPVVDPGVIDAVVGLVVTDERHPTDKSLEGSPRVSPSPDFAANRLPPPWGRTLPIGLDVEVVSRSALDRAWREADQPFQREHVMPFFYEGIPPEALYPLESSSQHTPHHSYSVSYTTSPRGFRVAQLHHFPNYGDYRWTVDTPADLELLRQIDARLDGRDGFSWYDILALFEREPGLATINASVPHKTAFDVDQRRSTGG